MVGQWFSSMVLFKMDILDLVSEFVANFHVLDENMNSEKKNKESTFRWEKSVSRQN